jgi:hypothetical protein
MSLPGIAGMMAGLSDAAPSLGGFGVLAYQSSPQGTGVTDGSLMEHQAEAYDDGGWFNSGSSTTQFTTRANLVRATSNLKRATSTTGDSQIGLLKNGAAVAGRFFADAPVANGASAILPVSGGTDLLTVELGGLFGVGSEAGNATWTSVEAVDASLKRALLAKSADQSIGAGATTALTWASATYDTDSFFNVGNSSRLTAPSSDYYFVGANIDGSSVSGQMVVTFEHYNSSDVLQSTRGLPRRDNDTGGKDFLNAWSAPISLTAGDYVIVNVFSTSARDVLSSAATWFAMEQVPSTWKKALIYKSANQSVTSAAGFEQVVLGGTSYDPDGMKSGNTLLVPSGCTRARPRFSIVTPSATGIHYATVRKNGSDYIGQPYFATDTAGTDALSGVGAWVDVASGDAFSLWFDAGANMTLADHNDLWFSLECQ